MASPLTDAEIAVLRDIDGRLKLAGESALAAVPARFRPAAIRDLVCDVLLRDVLARLLDEVERARAAGREPR